MNDKRGIVIGLLVGVILGLVGVLVTFHFTTAEMDKRQGQAYDRGYKEGMERAGKDGIAINQDAMQKALQTDQLRKQLDDLKTQLQALQGRDDLTPQAKDQVAGLIDGIK